MTQLVHLLIIGPAWMLIGLGVYVVATYARNIRSGGALGVHVTLISLSYVLLLLAVSAGNIARFNAPITWRSIVTLAAIALGHIALFTLLGDIGRRRDAQLPGLDRRQGDARTTT